MTFIFILLITRITKTGMLSRSACTRRPSTRLPFSLVYVIIKYTDESQRRILETLLHVSRLRPISWNIVAQQDCCATFPFTCEIIVGQHCFRNSVSQHCFSCVLGLTAQQFTVMGHAHGWTFHRRISLFIQPQYSHVNLHNAVGALIW